MFGTIYKITNKENGKIYIGQTIRTSIGNNLRGLTHKAGGMKFEYFNNTGRIRD